MMDALEKFDKTKKVAIWRVCLHQNSKETIIMKLENSTCLAKQTTRLNEYTAAKGKTWKIHDAEHRQNLEVCSGIRHFMKKQWSKNTRKRFIN